MTDSIELVRSYLEALTSGPNGLDKARALLSDDLEYHDALMGATTADGLIDGLRALGPNNSKIELLEIVGSDDTVVTLTQFEMPDGRFVAFTQWFWLGSGKIRRSQVIYDPRAFLESGQEGG